MAGTKERTVPPRTAIDQGLSTHQTATAIGVSYRVLDWWARHDVIRPSVVDTTGSGTHRQWSSEDVRVGRGLAQLSRHGAGLDVLGRVAPALSLWLTIGLDDMYVYLNGWCSPKPIRGGCWYLDLASLREP